VFLIDGFPNFGPDPLDWLDWFGLGFVSSLYIGGIIGLLYGVPLYTLYLRLDVFPLWALTVLAISPGLAMLFLEFSLGIFLLFGGAAFLIIVHSLARKWPQLMSRELPDSTLR